MYKVRPSCLLEIPDAYTSYCFDEACSYIADKIREGEEPIFEQEKKQKYSSFKDFYKKF